MRLLPALLLAIAPVGPAAHAHSLPAQAAPEAAIEAPDDVIVVRAERSGPRLWRVSHPDHDGEVYVFVTVRWLPASLEWNDRAVASVLEDARLVLTEFEVNSGAISTTRMAAMMLRTITFNRGRIMMPRGVTLADRVGEDLAAEFARASAIAEERNERRRQMRRAARRGAETEPAEASLETPSEEALAERMASMDAGRLHPFFQAMTLMGDAAGSADLAGAEAIERRVTRLARRHRARVRAVQSYDLAVADISTLMRSAQNFSRETDRTCIAEAVRFASTDLPEIAMVAHAWARGDVDTLRAHSARREALACQHAMEAELGGLRTLGGQTSEDIDYSGVWADAIYNALANGGGTLAVVDAPGWLREETGVMARLQASGMQVDGP